MWPRNDVKFRGAKKYSLIFSHLVLVSQFLHLLYIPFSPAFLPGLLHMQEVLVSFPLFSCTCMLLLLYKLSFVFLSLHSTCFHLSSVCLFILRRPLFQHSLGSRARTLQSHRSEHYFILFLFSLLFVLDREGKTSISYSLFSRLSSSLLFLFLQRLPSRPKKLKRVV